MELTGHGDDGYPRARAARAVGVIRARQPSSALVVNGHREVPVSGGARGDICLDMISARRPGLTNRWSTRRRPTGQSGMGADGCQMPDIVVHRRHRIIGAGA